MPLGLASLPQHLAAISCSSTLPHPHTAAISPDGTLLAWADSSSGLHLASVCHSSARAAECAGSLVRRGDPSGDEPQQSGSSGSGLSLQRHATPAALATVGIARVALTDSTLLVAQAGGSLLIAELATLSQVRLSLDNTDHMSLEQRGNRKALHAATHLLYHLDCMPAPAACREPCLCAVAGSSDIHTGHETRAV